MRFLVVNFHYIHEENKYPFPGIYSTPVERLIKQLEQIGRHFRFIGQEDLIGAIEGKKKLPDKCCLVTFDDGLKNQYENALPVLKQMGIPAIFFVNTLPQKEKKACLVHKIHWLRTHLPPDEFLEKIDNDLQLTSMKSVNSYFISEKKARTQYRYDKPNVAKLKFLLNRVLPEKIKEKIINKIFKGIVKKESEFCQNFYMSEEQLSELYKLSFLGIHSHSHKFLSQLPRFKDDIKKNIKTICGIVGGRKIQGISYPYGGPDAINSKVASYCHSLGLKFGFTMERAFNQTLNNPLLFARMDTNDVPGGKYPIFEFEKDKIKILRDTSLARKIYFKEI